MIKLQSWSSFRGEASPYRTCRRRGGAHNGARGFAHLTLFHPVHCCSSLPLLFWYHAVEIRQKVNNICREKGDLCLKVSSAIWNELSIPLCTFCTGYIPVPQFQFHPVLCPLHFVHLAQLIYILHSLCHRLHYSTKYIVVPYLHRLHTTYRLFLKATLLVCAGRSVHWRSDS